MIRTNGARLWIVLLIAACEFAPRYAESQTPREQLQQYVTQLQANPSDNALRQNILQLAPQVQPPPEVPTDALEAEGGAEYLFKSAQSPADFIKAAAEFEKALQSAPWIGHDYYNLAFCYEKAGSLDKAIADYQLYLFSLSDGSEKDALVQHIGALKVQLDQQTQRQQQRAAAQAAAEAQREAEQRLNGTYICRGCSVAGVNRSNQITYDLIVTIADGQVTWGSRITSVVGYYRRYAQVGTYGTAWTVPVEDTQFHYQKTDTGLDQCRCVDATLTWDGTVDANGGTISVTWTDSSTDGQRSSKAYTFYRQ